VPNRLARETSPYLQQHAHNPVDWYPWGPEGLERARAEDRPILLSIGYSACHWCHVMERESFDDPATADLMNRHFVCIKVDREERPDVDAVYMRAVQAMTGQGGWPLTAFLTPEGEPFHGGTYFPPEPRHGMPSFQQLLGAVADAWNNRRDAVRKGAGELREMLERSVSGGGAGGRAEAGSPVDVGPGRGGEAPSPEDRLTPGLLEHAARFAASHFDPVHGGFGRAPKFPQPVTLDLLLREHARSGDPQPLTMVAHSLVRMLRGGIFDQLGGGFHRYAVDARWLVPHFEKMLYDQALLARVLVDAWLLNGDPELRRGAERTLEYVLEDLRSEEGGFVSARDADSEGEEGIFYLWTPEQVAAVLPPEEARLFMRCHDVTRGGNFEGRNILHLPHDPDAIARGEGFEEPEELTRRLEAARGPLLEARARREPPFRDDKVIAAWNGYTIRTLAEAGASLDRPDFLAAAREAAAFVLAALRVNGVLHRIRMAGESRIPGFLEDHAAVGNALLSLHEATLEPRWLAEAVEMADLIHEHFWEEAEGILYDTAAGGEPLVVRPRDIMDNATPSGTSLAVELWLRLEPFTGDPRGHVARARRILEGEVEGMARYPTAFGRLLGAVERLVSAPVEIVISGPREDPAVREMLRVAHRHYLPVRAITGLAPGDPPLPFPTPLLEGRAAAVTTAWVCRNRVCGLPVHDGGGLAEALAGN
jgi:uncharacterized protein